MLVLDGILHSALRQTRPGPVLVEGDCAFEPEQVLNTAQHLAEQLSAEGPTKVLVKTSRVADLLTTLVAAEMAGCALFVAHQWMTEAVISQLAQEQGFNASFQAGEDWMLHVGSGDRQEWGDSLFPVFMMTSGTTGMPKLAQHSLESLVGRIRQSASKTPKRWLMTYPPTTFAGVQVLLTSVLTGGTLVTPSDNGVEALAKAASQYEVTHISGTPTFWRSLLLFLGTHGSLPALVQITLGGETVDQRTLDRLGGQFPQARITQIYASTEAGSLFAVHDGYAGFPASWLQDGVEDIRLRIRDGVLEAWSARRAAGYVSKDPFPLTDEGWLSTGDLVMIENDRVFFTGRTDGRLNIGGYKVSQEEIEAVLLQVDGVAEVRVQGAPSPLTGQVLVAEFVCLSGEDPDAVRRKMLQHARLHLEPYKVPRVLRVVESIPSAGSGKKYRGG